MPVGAKSRDSIYLARLVDKTQLFMKVILLFTLVSAFLPTTKGGPVVLTSDPPGSTIFVGDKELGTTPLTADLAKGPIALTSRFGTLAPVVQTVVADDDQVVASHFKHSYGELVVDSDRTDGTLSIDGMDFGHPPSLIFLPPGAHKVFVTVPNAPEKTRIVNIIEGTHSSVVVHFSGDADSGVGPNSSKPASSPNPRQSQVIASPDPTEAARAILIAPALSEATPSRSDVTTTAVASASKPSKALPNARRK